MNISCEKNTVKLLRINANQEISLAVHGHQVQMNTKNLCLILNLTEYSCLAFKIQMFQNQALNYNLYKEREWWKKCDLCMLFVLLSNHFHKCTMQKRIDYCFCFDNAYRIEWILLPLNTFNQTSIQWFFTPFPLPLPKSAIKHCTKWLK